MEHDRQNKIRARTVSTTFLHKQLQMEIIIGIVIKS